MKRILSPGRVVWMTALLGATTSLMIVSLMSGCGGQGAGPELGRYSLGFVAQGENPDYESLLERSARRSALELAHVFGDIEIRWSSPGDTDGGTQADIIRAYLEEGVDGIALCYVEQANPESVVEAIEAAMDAGVPVITFGRDAPDSLRITYLGSEEALYGFLMAQSLYSALEGEGRCVILAGEGETQQLRLEALELEFVSFDGIDVVEIIQCKGAEDAPRLLREALARNADIEAWGFLDDWLLRTSEGRAALAGLSGFKASVSHGGPTVWPHLESSLVEELIVPARQDWGAASVRILLDIIVNEKPFPDRTGVKPIRLDADSLERYRVHWANWFDKDTE